MRKDGSVVVDGKVVATNALSIGRTSKPGSSNYVVNGKTYYERTPAASFASNSIVAYVYFNADGRFKAAVLTSCGNPVRATPPKPPEPPKPQPAFACESLTAAKINRTEYSFNAKANASNGATIVNYTYDFGDGKKETVTASTIKHTYAKEGTYTATVTVNVKVGNETKPATANSCKVQVVIETPPVTPTHTCDSLTASKISRTEYSFDAKATVSGGATIVNYTYDFGDGKKETITGTNIKHTYEKEGSYNVTLTVNVKVGNETKAVTANACKVKITVDEMPVIPTHVCDALTASKISRAEYSFDGKATVSGGATIVDYVFDFGDGESVTVTNPSNVKHTYEKAGAYTAKLSVTVKVNGENKTVVDATKCVTKVNVAPEECKPGIPTGDVRCTPCEVPGKEDFPKDSPECVTPPVTPPETPETPETPAELPQTGTADMIASGIGLGSIIGAAYYWQVSRRNLLIEMLKR